MGHTFTSTALAALMLGVATPVIAQSTQAVRTFSIGAGPLERSLPVFAQQSGLQILYPSALVAGRQARALTGDYTPEAALAELLRGTGLTYRQSRPTVFVLVDPSARAEAEPQATQLEEVVVTGTYLRGADSPSPVTVITQDDIARQGRATVAETLAALPQNFTGAAYEGSAGTGADRTSRNSACATGVNLRGLGADATLVLVNGRRIAGTGSAGDFSDISNLPSSAIARADVLLDGASALYGADAVGGVVNIILKSRFDGTESRLRVGGTSDGGAEELLLSHSGGFNWSSGGLIAAYEFHDRGELRAADRRATANADLRPLGGSDWRFTYAAPGNLMAFDPVSGSYEPVYAIPRNQNGVGLAPGDFRLGEVNLTNQMEGLWSLPHQRRHSLFVAGRQDLPGGFSLDGDLRYTDRTYSQDSVADIGILFVTPDNPFFVPVAGELYQEIAYSFINDLGPGRDEGFSRSVGGAVGITGELAGWNLAAYLSGGRETTGLTASNRVQTTRLDEALGATPDNPGTAFNPAVDGYFNSYGDPAAHSPALLAFIGSGYLRSENVSTVGSFNLKADGVLFALPGGDLRMAVGVDYRQERFETSGENFISGATPRIAAPTAFDRDVSAAFVELRAPLVGPDNARPGLERLELSLAGRIEDHEGIGQTSNPKVGVLYNPTPDLLLRASYGTSFRAPSLRELNSAYRLGPVFLDRAGANVISIVQYGGNPDLIPETAESWTAGFVWTPAAVEGLRIEAGWFRTTFEDRIATPVAENLINALNDPTLAPFIRYVSPGSNAEDRAYVQSLLSHPGNFNPNVFPATAYGAVIDNRYVNASAVEVEGLDLSTRYRFTLGSDDISLDASITHLLTNDRAVTAASPTEDLLGAPNFPARWRGRFGAQWLRGPLTLGGALNHVSGGRDRVNGRGIDDWITVDGQVRYDLGSGWPEGLSFTLNVLNLTNEEPPFYDAPAGIGYDAANTNVLGRQISLQLVKRW
ncbi:TonB-dependent receptor [Brevundimonas sp. SORGH_AS_0993]|uniref:TonB-dependent receptor n=1 Tax=Brevundimonas sp. SORGH_AS_0993 TaxID=3041794 RepID=UPI00277F2445|nr:TonB-dependent receptor [Brevundimonas sp. SORGH_AS_0993]MDQ1153088.1 iron complex outermembrane receptor protein [Brevundimonas sp. SORGH_AS_0993]